MKPAQESRYAAFGKYRPTRWERIRRRSPSLTIRYRRGSGWTVRRRWRSGSTCEARGTSLRWALRHTRRGGAMLVLPVVGGDITPGPTHTHVFGPRKTG